MIFDGSPSAFHPQFEVASCYVQCLSEVLLLLRNENKPEGGSYCVPGGHIETGEAPVAAAARELFEETGIRTPVEAFTPLRTFMIRYPTHDFVYHTHHLLLFDKPSISLRLDEHTDYLWTPPRKALELRLMMDEAACIRKIYHLAR